jgi:DNA-3-methyladenine glycosylase II
MSALTDAVDAVTSIDPVMAALAEQHGPPKLGGRRSGKTRFEELAEAICYQQLAGRAAEAIWRRVVAAVGDPFTPEAVLSAGFDALRGSGFSRAKAESVLDLATRVHRGEVGLDRIGRLDDAAVVQQLTLVKGIGPWTAEMFLIFTLKRLNVWPVGDYGVRAGYAKAYDLPALPTPKELLPLGDRFAPYRTVAAWYCWRAVSTQLPT